MLNGIHVVDYTNHRDTRLTFGRMTALVGQNGSGKTNALNAILKVSALYNGLPDSRSGSHITRKGREKWIISASWEKTFRENAGDWGFVADPFGAGEWLWRAASEEKEGKWVPDPYLRLEEISLWDNGVFNDAPNISRAWPIKPTTIIRPSHRSLRNTKWSSQYFKTAGTYLQGPSYSEQFPPKLQMDCRDLAWVISYLKGDKDEAFADIIHALRMVVPVVRKVRHRPVPVTRVERKDILINKQSRTYDEEQQVMGQELRFDMASGEDLPASAISEGTLVTLAILTAIMQDGDADGSQTILLDDIESGLHPKAQRDLVKQLRRLQETRPELQIIFSSHSPYIIDEMKPEEVWLFATDEQGCSRSAKLSDHPDAKRATEVLTTGEFWSAEGEAWVLDPEARQLQELQPTA